MIVCVCNGLCERRCQEAAGRPQCRSVGCIYRGLGGRVRCGRCVPVMREIFAAAKARGPGAEFCHGAVADPSAAV